MSARLQMAFVFAIVLATLAYAVFVVANARNLPPVLRNKKLPPAAQSGGAAPQR
mgnify:CR=1 FL=1